MECYCHPRNVEDLLADRKNALVKGDSENHLMAHSFRLVQWVEYRPISSRDQPRLHQIGEKVLTWKFLGHVLIEENLERTHYGCGH